MNRRPIPVTRDDDDLHLVAEMQRAPEDVENVSWKQVLAAGVILGMIAGLSYLFWTRAN